MDEDPNIFEINVLVTMIVSIVAVCMDVTGSIKLCILFLTPPVRSY